MAVLELCELMDIPARIGEITKDELLEADEVFMASMAEGIMPIRRIDDRILSNGAPGRSRSGFAMPIGPSVTKGGTPPRSTMPKSTGDQRYG